MPIRWTRGRNCAAPVPMRVHGALTEPLPSETLAQILPQDQPLTDTRRRYSGVRKLGERLHLTLDGPLSGSSPASLASARAPLSELFPWLPMPAITEQWHGWIALTSDLLPHVHELAPGLWSGLGHSGRGIAAATVAGRDLARRVLARPECEITFPLTWLRPLPNRTAGPRRGRNHCCLPHPRSARCVA
jgi:glycine/D-amino acid oxidase-like deaminating enzyme